MFYRIIRIALLIFMAVNIICFFFPIIYYPDPEVYDRDLVYSDYYRNILNLFSEGSNVSVAFLVINGAMPGVSLLIISSLRDQKKLGFRIASIITGFFLGFIAQLTHFILVFNLFTDICLSAAGVITLFLTAISGLLLIVFGIVPGLFKR